MAMLALLSAAVSDGFQISSIASPSGTRTARQSSISVLLARSQENEDKDAASEPSRRSLLVNGPIALGGSMFFGQSLPSLAAVGTLPEFSDTNAILQGLTVNVADQSQQKSMIEFLINGLGFQVLRQRIFNNIEETVRKGTETYARSNVKIATSSLKLTLIAMCFP